MMLPKQWHRFPENVSNTTPREKKKSHPETRREARKNGATLKRVNMALTFVCAAAERWLRQQTNGIGLSTLHERTYVNTSHVDTLFITLARKCSDILLCYHVVASLFRNFFIRCTTARRSLLTLSLTQPNFQAEILRNGKIGSV